MSPRSATNLWSRTPGLKAYDLGTGALKFTYITLPNNELGGSIWSSPALDTNGNAFATIGNDLPGAAQPGDSSSLVSLSASSLARTGGWRVPPAQQVEDNDWAASPTVFQATINGTPTEMVTACNKNGFLYAFNAASITPGPVWSFQVGAGTGNGVLSCLGAAIWNGTNLFEPGNATTINGTAYNGSMRELNPATGAPIWATGLPGIILGSPSMDSGWCHRCVDLRSDHHQRHLPAQRQHGRRPQVDRPWQGVFAAHLRG